MPDLRRGCGAGGSGRTVNPLTRWFYAVRCATWPIVPNHYSDIQWGNIQPRLAVAYQIGKKTVLRAGGGRFITRLGVSDSVFLGGNPPFQPNGSVTDGSADNPGAGGRPPSLWW
jgi:hypothetical protein